MSWGIGETTGSAPRAAIGKTHLGLKLGIPSLQNQLPEIDCHASFGDAARCDDILYLRKKQEARLLRHEHGKAMVRACRFFGSYLKIDMAARRTG